jgi:hypothetical protein
MKAKLVLTLLAASSVLAAPTLAALRYETRIEVIRKDETEYFNERVTTRGDNARIDFLDAEGNPDGSYLVTNDGGSTLAIHDGSRSICANWDRAEFFGAAGTILEKGKSRVRATVTSVDRSVLDREAGPDILGYATEHLIMRTNYSAQGRFLFFKFNYSVEEVDQVWMSSELPLPAFEAQWLQAGAHTGSEFIDEHATKWNSLVDQTVLRHTNIITVTNAKSGKVQFKKTENFTVENVERLLDDDVALETFTMPACKKVKQADMEHQAERMLKKYIK